VFEGLTLVEGELTAGSASVVVDSADIISRGLLLRAVSDNSLLQGNNRPAEARLTIRLRMLSKAAFANVQ